ncbi:MAG: hypothetical protein ACPLRY_03065 [Candidatus Bathyarchaeales archaeon]
MRRETCVPAKLPKNLLTAVEEGLSMLGDSPKQAIIFHIENSFKIKREEIPKNLTEFTKALEKIFGPGAPYIERLILKRLHDKLNLEFENSENLDFLNSVENLRRIFPEEMTKI